MADAPDILSAIRQIASERKIDINEILEAIKEAIKNGYEREYNSEEDIFEVEFDPEKGYIAVFVRKNVVKEVEDKRIEISVDEAKKLDKTLKVGDSVLIDITNEGDFGRIAAQTARQVILQKLRESEKEAAIKEVEHNIGEIESVTIQRVLPEGDILCEINRARAIMPKDERVPTEFYAIGSRVKVLLKSIEEDTRGKYILVSRASSDFLKALFKLEVPEIDSGSVEIVAIAREAGSRSKVAVKSNADGIDPIGSCIGQKGVRINAIMNELKLGKIEEKVDVILYDEDIKEFIMNAIRPAEALSVVITDETEKSAKILVPNEQHSLAIGREGQNARLANKLTGWNIEIESDAPAPKDEKPDEAEPIEEASSEEVEK